MRDAAGHDILLSVFMLFFLRYGKLFCLIQKSRRRLNGVFHSWSGLWFNVLRALIFGCGNVVEFEIFFLFIISHF